MTVYTDHPTRKGDVYWISGRRWNSQMKTIDYACGVTDDEFRFEIQRGDYAWCDPNGDRQRSEFACWDRLPFGKALTLEWDMLVEPGPPTDRGYVVVGQLHQDDNLPTHPVFALNLQSTADKLGEVVQIDLNYGTAPGVYLTRPPTNLVPFTRGVRHHVKLAGVDARGQPTGSLYFEFDGVPVLSLSNITTGYVDAVQPSYAKLGVYSGNPTQPADKTMVVHLYRPDIGMAA